METKVFGEEIVEGDIEFDGEVLFENDVVVTGGIYAKRVDAKSSLRVGESLEVGGLLRVVGSLIIWDCLIVGEWLKVGGTLILADFHKHEQEIMRSRYGDHWLGFEPGEIESMLSDAGFRIEEQHQYAVRKGLKVLLYRSRSKERSGGPSGEA